MESRIPQVFFNQSQAELRNDDFGGRQFLYPQLSTLFGDLDGNGGLDVVDIDLLTAAALSDESHVRFDLNQDGSVDGNDRTVWVGQAFGTTLGDSNLDGRFDSSDFVKVFAAGRFETNRDAGWGEGDWSGDGVFSSTDLIAAFVEGGFVAETQPVPEPKSGYLILSVVLCCVTYCRRIFNDGHENDID